MSKVTLAIPDMTCSSCEGHVRAALDLSGVSVLAVDLRKRVVTLEVSASEALPLALSRIAEEGYTATVVEQ